jgi:hypothetical protein
MFFDEKVAPGLVGFSAILFLVAVMDLSMIFAQWRLGGF